MSSENQLFNYQLLKTNLGLKISIQGLLFAFAPTRLLQVKMQVQTFYTPDISRTNFWQMGAAF
ncbi:MAG: hypothetical protein EAZ77_11425 [Nostocales cyanobacterium]|nr:MAG: hypothetical protein EAZ77_11425 [Nostocales cyanobacterium]